MSRRRIGFWYRLAAIICKPLLVVLFKRDWRGMEHIPAAGGFITVVNHNSYLDPLSYAHFQYNSGRVPRFLAKAGLFKAPFVGMMLRGTGQIPVYRESTDAATAFKAAVDAVNSGECVAVYPEGTLTRDPDLWPMTGKTGAARIALMTGAPVVPVAQWGAHEAMPPYAKEKRLRLFPRKTFRVLAGPPVDLSAYLGKDPTVDVLRGATDTIMESVTALLAELRDEPAPTGSYDERRRIAAAAAKRQILERSEKKQVAAAPAPADTAGANGAAKPGTNGAAKPGTAEAARTAETGESSQ
ncbi:lysophospholipid acyltransferase family protein [Wenjunlia tyrosinilytica]|uniref:1-acyl-sn-glycerol-3-phosphate acyltransferase n=1 Tax=Wenjunlia tyrosinilytica TaxID=1544741 RepID=A0A918E0S0_9ACTN|nr:lysophospholipid acyltransferase family protein [Wenjunlia tyrosinilytica]GGO93880.1 1-acyl-sn-glycerol-3-phosphate acyltransferase [Wenjunlia tyrosinilytica]